MILATFQTFLVQATRKIKKKQQLVLSLLDAQILNHYQKVSGLRIIVNRNDMKFEKKNNIIKFK